MPAGPTSPDQGKDERMVRYIKGILLPATGSLKVFQARVQDSGFGKKGFHLIFSARAAAALRSTHLGSQCLVAGAEIRTPGPLWPFPP